MTDQNRSLFAAGGLPAKALSVILPKGKPPAKAITPTYNPASPSTVLTIPAYREHLTDIFDTRQASDARVLIKNLMVNDPDMSAATSAYLTVANTNLICVAKDADDKIDRPAQKILNAILQTLTTRYDYSKGFEFRPSLKALCESMRYMILLRGMLAAEMVFTKEGVFDEIRMVDPISLKWFETKNGVATPKQAVSGQDDIDLNYQTFFVSFFRQDPTTLYPNSPFVSAINTIAARQQVINDLYRIMQVTGYPRMELSVLEEVLLKNAPPAIKSDATKKDAYVAAQITAISGAVGNLQPDQPFVHTDSIKVGMINEGKPGMALNIEPIIKTLNAQNQAGLRAVSTILGRGESGVNTASVEARIFSMTAQELNEPIAELLNQILTMALRMTGSQSKVVCSFQDVELRPALELEPQLNLRSARLRQDLSDGIIDDDEYHLKMYGRIRPDSSPILSGTGFMVSAAQGPVDPSAVSPNTDPTGRSVASSRTKAPASNATPKPAAGK